MTMSLIKNKPYESQAFIINCELNPVWVCLCVSSVGFNLSLSPSSACELFSIFFVFWHDF